MSEKAFLRTEFENLQSSQSGKVRDIFDLGRKLLIVTTDRISAYDVILPNGIPGKGKVLNKLSEFWFNKTKNIVSNHLITMDVSQYPDEFQKYSAEITDRSMLVLKTIPLSIECVVRGYISGSAWIEYKETNSVCDIKLPEGLLESSKLETPIFTPATKAEKGEHDENISFNKACDLIGEDLATKVRELSISIYKMARDFAYHKGIIIADTKFEFGVAPETGELILIDEVLTPDSSRFWPASDYEPGRTQKSFDKQFVRDYLNSINWNRKPPAPVLPPEIVEKTAEKYLTMLQYFS